MYYHVIVETTKLVGKDKKPEEHYELDRSDPNEITEEFIVPYLNKEELHIDGYFVKSTEIKRLVVTTTNKSSEILAKEANDRLHSGDGMILFFYSGRSVVEGEYATDVTKQMLSDARKKLSVPSKIESKAEKDKSKIFIVHGHDDLAKTDTARFIDNLGFSPIILHEQASGGKTIIEKIEEYSDVGFGVVLYTPCDIGSKAGEDPDLKSRARQNVVFEHGFLIGKLGRCNVCALVKGDVETPNDISGVVYVPVDDAGAWKFTVAKEMRNSGYDVDMNKI